MHNNLSGRLGPKTHPLVVVGQTPPPNNGQAKMIEQMLQGVKGRLDLVHIRMAFSDSVVSAGKCRLYKLLHLFALIGQTRRALKKYPGATLYYPPASPAWVPVLRDLLFLSAVKGLAARTVYHFHAGGISSWLEQRSWLRRLARKVYSTPDLAIELGPSCPHDGAYFMARKVVSIPYGLDVPVHHGTAPVQMDELSILYVGIHTESKGLFDLLETARLLHERNVRFTLHTVGLWYTRQERERFDKLRSTYHLDNRVVLNGERTGDSLWRHYAQSNVFFFPTHYPWETFGIVQVEAMAYGLPVVATDWPGPRDVVVHGETGILCPPHDVEAMAAALERLACEPDTRKRLGDAGRTRYLENYTAQKFVDRMVDALTFEKNDVYP